jgi:hypothetical protein
MIESNQQKYNEIESNLEEESMKYENTKMLINEMNAKANIPKLVFKVKKLGVKGYTHKTRLLYITPEKISYYYMVEKNEKTQKFLNLLNSLYKVIKNEEYDKQVYKEMVEEFDSLPDDQKVLKHSFRKYEILVQDHFSSFNKAPIKINNLEKKNENEKTKTQDFWIMETGDECFRKTVFDSQKVIEDYLNNIKNKEKEDMSTNFATNRRLEMASTNTKYNNREFSYMKSLHYDYYDEIPKKKKVKTKEVFTLEKDKIHYIGIYFQGFVREYLGQINKNMQKKIQNKNRYSMKNVNEQKKETKI